MEAFMLMGDEAIAQAALDAGISGIYAYPGTPSTEITEYVQASEMAKRSKVCSNWAVNEKTAMEAALGMSYAGKRSMVCMKHVGLNVAADAFINSALTGVNGGLVVTVADDPSMHSSQNEQDSRFYGKFSMIPMLEPSNQQEAYDMAYAAFDLSEKFHVPILFRITTRLAHSRAGVIRKVVQSQKSLSLPSDLKQFILLPAIARIKYAQLLKNQQLFKKESESSIWNNLQLNSKSKLGVITTGIAYNYVREQYPDNDLPFSLLRIGQYPIPVMLIHELVAHCSEVLVFEEGFAFVEEQIKGILPSQLIVKGRLDGTLPADGELNPNLVGRALGFPTVTTYKNSEIVINRPPSLCNGCSHIDLYNALNEAMEKYGKGRVFSDIGCYTLGALAPFDAINSCVDMGASVTMAKGAADAGLFPSACVIGDSTFTHSGMTGLLDAINDASSVTIIISDNLTTGMTGGQKSAATGRLESICLGMGVESEHLKIITPLKKKHSENVQIIKHELSYRGVSVIIAQRECIQTAARKHKQL